MLKKSILSIFALGLLAVSGLAQAQNFCEGKNNGPVIPVADLDGNPRPYAVSCCPPSYRLQGIACSDMNNSHNQRDKNLDTLDVCTAVCRHVTNGNFLYPNRDMQRKPAVYQCDKTEIVDALYCKDSHRHGGGTNSDYADGCTVGCYNPRTKQRRVVYSADIATNPRPASVVTVNLPERVTGIACKDVVKETGSTNSDRADGCTFVKATYLPIVKR